MQKKRIYLAGPDVFFPNMIDIRDKKLKICSTYGMLGVFPIDNNPLPDLSKKNLGRYICRKNKGLIVTCQGIIANITPFRGIGVDPGTAYEIGYADALRRPIFGYTNNPDSFLLRTKIVFNGKFNESVFVDEDGFIIEDFNMVDNLMIDTSILDSSKTLIVPETTEPFDSLYTFEKAVYAAKKYFDELEKLD